MVEEERIDLNAQPAVRAVDQLMGAYQRLNSEVVRTNSLISEHLKRTESLRGVSMGSRSMNDPQVTELLAALKDLNRQRAVVAQAVATPSMDATLRNAEATRQQREEAYLKTREARIELLNRRIALANGAERENLRIKQQRLVVDREEIRMARGQTNEFERQKIILDRMLETQRERTAEARRQTQLENLRRVPQNREELAARAGVGVAIARERVVGSGASDTFEIQTGLTANFLVIAQLLQAMRFVTGFVVDFDKALFNLQAITSATDGTMGKFRMTVEDVANSTKFTAVEVSEAAKVLGQAGFSATEVQQALGAVAQYASATGIEMKDAVDVMTSALSVFNMTALQATDVANTFTAAINNSKLTQQQLGLAFSYVANAANQSGISFKDLTAALAGLANAGIRSGSTIGTNLRAFIVDLQTPSDNLRKTLETLGLTMFDIDLAANGLSGVIQNLRYAGFGASEAFASLETRSAAAFLALSGQADSLDRIRLALTGTNAAARASDTQMQSLANTFANTLSVVGTSSLKAFEPTVRSLQTLAETFNLVVMGMNRAASDIPAVGIAFNVMGAAVTGLGAIALVTLFSRLSGVNGEMLKSRGAALASSMSYDRLKGAVTSAGLSYTAKTAAIRAYSLETLRANAAASSKATVLAGLRIQLLNTTAAMGATSLGARTLAAAMTAATVAGRALQSAVALLGGPLGLFIGALTLLPMLVSNFANQQERLNRALDDAQTAFDGALSRYEQTESVLVSLRTEMDSLIAQERLLRRSEEDLAGGQMALRARAAELVEMYGRLGLNINSLTVTYDELVAAMARLRAEQSRQLGADARELAIAARGDLRAQSDVLTSRNFRDDPMRPTIGIYRAFERNGLDYSLTRQAEAQRVELNRLISSGNMEQAKVLAAEIRDVTVTAILRQLDSLPEVERTSTDIQNFMRGLLTAQGQMSAFINSVIATGEAERNSELTNMLNTPELQRRGSQADEVNVSLTRAFNDVRAEPGLSPRQREERFNELVQPLLDRADELYEELFGPNSVLTDDQIRALRSRGSGVDVLLRGLSARAEGYKETLIEDSIEEINPAIRTYLRAINAGIQADITGLRHLRNPQELAAATAELESRLEQYAAMRMRQFALSIGISESQFDAMGGVLNPDTLTPEQRDGLDATVTEIATKMQQSQEQILNTSQRIESNMRMRQLDSINRVISNLERSMRELLDSTPIGTDRSFRTDQLNQQLAMIDQAQAERLRALAIERLERNMDPETVRGREQDIREDAQRNRERAIRAAEDDLRQRELDDLSSVISRMENQFRFIASDMPDGSGRTTMERVQLQQLALLERLEELEREKLRLEAERTRMDNETRARRENEISETFDRRRFELNKAAEQRQLDQGARSLQEALGDIRQRVMLQFMSEAAQEARSFASVFRDSIMAAVDASQGAMSGFFRNVLIGAKSVGEAFREMAFNILDAMLQVLTSKIAEQFLSMLINFGLGKIAPSTAPSSGFTTGGGFIGAGNWQGGYIRAFGGRGITTRDTVPALLADGEYVLRQSAVNAIGKDRLDEINALGNRAISQSSSELKPFLPPPAPPVTTNVWVVSEDQMPPMGPNDIIATVVNDGRRGGSVKQLIKQVVAGM